MASSSAQSTAGRNPFIASAGELVYLWGGLGDKEPEALFIYSHATETWTTQLTEGAHPPTGLCNGGCTLSGHCIFLYGGWDGKSCHGDLYEFNTKNWMWKKVCDGGTEGPGKKSGCRMVSYESNLLVVGGHYDKTLNSRQVGASYSKKRRTNEVHSYDLATGKR